MLYIEVNDNKVANNMSTIDGKLTVATVSIAKKDITGSMFEVNSGNLSFIGTNNILENEVDGDLINSEVDMNIEGQFLVDNNTIEDNLIYTTKAINIDAKFSLTEKYY